MHGNVLFQQALQEAAIAIDLQSQSQFNAADTIASIRHIR